MTDTIETMKDKIARLMAMGNDSRTNEFEAEAALRQAAKLMRMHCIEAVELQERTGQKPVYNWRTINVPARNPPSRVAIGWLGSIGVDIARMTDTKAEWHRTLEWGMCLKYSGDAIDVEYAVYLTKHLRDSTFAAVRAFNGDKRDKESFKRAMAARLCERMQQLNKERNDELKTPSASSCKALAVIQNKIALRDEQFGKFKVKTGRSSANTNRGATYGRQAGNNVGFGRPVEANGTRRMTSF